MDDKALTVSQLADRWQCSRQHVYSMIERGEIVAFKIGRSTRISAAEIRRIENPPNPETETTA